MEWSNEQCLDFLGEYKNHEILWNPKHKLYYSKNGKHDAWDKISKKLNIEVDELKKKILSLLGSYRREKARIKKSMGTGKGANEIYVSKWFAFKSMHFLADRDEPRLTLSTENVLDETESESGSNSLEQDEDIVFPDRSVPNSDGILTQSFSDDSFVCPTPPVRIKKIKRSSKTESDSKIDEAFDILKQAAASTNSQMVPPDESTSYGQYVGNKIRNYHPKTRSIVQHQYHHISNILFEADMGKFDYGLSSSLNSYQNPININQNTSNSIAENLQTSNQHVFHSIPLFDNTLQQPLSAEIVSYDTISHSSSETEGEINH